MALIDVGDVRLNVLTPGGDGPPLVLVHGNLASADWYRLCFDQLAARFRLICVEWRGCGGSDKPEPLPNFANYSPRQHALDILEVLRVVGIEGCDMVGHSTGAIIGNYMACAEPRRFRKIVCLDPVPPQSLAFDAKAQAFFAAAQQDPRLARWALAGAMCSLFEPETLEAGRTPAFRPTTSESQRMLFDRLVGQACAASTGVWLGTPLTLDRLHAANDLVPRVAEIAHPHLILYGCLDRVIPLAEVQAMTTIVRNTTFRIIEGIGHSANVERPELFAELVIEFLGS
jgi:pimeloyl-ACP methyl ester carboxylesterase